MVYATLSGDPDVRHAFATGSVDEMRYRVVTRLCIQSVEAHGYKVGGLARRYRTDFVAEAERYVEILVDRGISRRLPDSTWQTQIDAFTRQVRQGQTLQGFLDCIQGCGAHLKQHLPASHSRNELPNRLVLLP